MLKRDITYEDFNGNTVTETFYFNLTKTEIIEFQVSFDGGLDEFMKNIIKTENNKSLLHEFKRLLLLSYGIKSDDGKRFMKSDQLREEFSQMAAFDALFMELATKEDALNVFIRGIVPTDFAKEIDKAALSVVPPTPPVPPVPPMLS